MHFERKTKTKQKTNKKEKQKQKNKQIKKQRKEKKRKEKERKEQNRTEQNRKSIVYRVSTWIMGKKQTLIFYFFKANNISIAIAHVLFEYSIIDTTF
jgi:uncharacterized membrane protein YdbT with pleckstrin-like domain